MKIFTTEAEQAVKRASRSLLERLLKGGEDTFGPGKLQFEGELDVALQVSPGTVRISPQGPTGIRIDIPMFLTFD